MERNKRNSIAAFPTWTDCMNEDRDVTGGFGVGEMGLNSPSQVSLCVFLFRVMHQVHKKHTGYTVLLSLGVLCVTKIFIRTTTSTFAFIVFFTL